MNDLLESLDELSAALEAAHQAPSTLIQGPPVQITDLYETHKDLFSPQSQEALQKPRALSQVLHRDVVNEKGVLECQYSFCQYLCVRVKSENLLEGIQAIASDINALSERGLIDQVLLRPSSVELPKTFGESQSSAVACYVLIPQLRMDEFLSLVKNNTVEGQIGNAIGSLELDLPEGEFLVHVRLSAVEYMVDKDTRLNEEIALYLAVLPKGTELVSITECGVSQLSLGYEVRFRNPLMKQFKEVRLVQVRMAEAVDDRIVQFNLLHHVEYILRDGTVFR